MADKILSLDSVKKCLENVKNWVSKNLDKCVKTFTGNNSDINEFTTPGFHRLGTNANVPAGGVEGFNKWGNLVVVKSPEADTLAQLYFSSRNTNQTQCFAARWGGEEKNQVNTFTAGQWLYFHGSTSPNIPVLKRIVSKKTTTSTGNISLAYFSINIHNSIVLSAAPTKTVPGASPILLPYINGNGDWYLHVIGDVVDNKTITNEEVSFVVYYLEVPSGYRIPENTIASSDETEDDEGLSPQAE